MNPKVRPSKIGKTNGVFIMELRLKDKLAIISSYESGLPWTRITRKYNVAITTFQKKTRQYREYGKSSFQ